MTKNYPISIALFLLACLIIVIVPVSALQSTEQSISDSLTRGSRFTVTITGLPNTAYYIWLPGTFTMSGEQYDQPPVIADSQADIEKDPTGGPYTIGSYQYNNGGGRTILDDVAPSTATMSCTNYYAQVTTDETGRAVVEFQTSVYTGLRSYSIRVENPLAPESENFQIEQKVYSRSAARPMVNTPVSTIAIPVSTIAQLTTHPSPSLTRSPETLPITTPVPVTLPLPTKKAPLDLGITALAVGIGMMALIRR